MINEKNKEKKGFSGLSDLSSKIDFDDNPNSLDANIISPSPTIQSQEKVHSFSLQEDGNNSPSSSFSPPKSRHRNLPLIIFLIITVGYFIFIPTLLDKQKSKNFSLSSSSSLQSDIQKTTKNFQHSEIQYIKPPVGTSHRHSVLELQWCLRERVRLGAMKDYIYTDRALAIYNHLITDYNKRCGEFLYSKYDLPQAQQYIESYREQITTEAIDEAKQLNIR